MFMTVTNWGSPVCDNAINLLSLINSIVLVDLIIHVLYNK